MSKLTTVKFTPKQREVLERVRDKIVLLGWREMGVERADLPTYSNIIEEALLQWEKRPQDSLYRNFVGLENSAAGRVSTAAIHHPYKKK